MGKSLSELVNAALSEADQSIKVASARDAVLPDHGDFLAAELAVPKLSADEDDEKKAKEKEKDEAKAKGEEKTSSDQSILDDASYGIKLAKALETAAGVVTQLNTKVAEVQHTKDAPGPAVHRSGHLNESTKSPTATSTVKEMPSTTESSQGQPNGIRTNDGDYRDPDWTKNKEAAARLIRAKVAQAETLERMGQFEAAQQLVAQAEQLEAKLAADPSSPQANMPAHNESFKLDTTPGAATHVPDNGGMISMTRASARDKSQREAGQFFSEPAKKDPAVAAHVGKSDGLKISSMKIARKTPIEHDEKFQGRVGAGLLGVQGAALGAAGGGIASEAAGDAVRRAGTAGRVGKITKTLAKHPGKAMAAGALLGAAAGGTGGRALGRWGARKQRESDEARAEMMAEAMKKSSSLDETQIDAARVYLKKVAEQANDPNASPEERQKAASLISAVRERAAARTQSPEELLS